MSTEVRVGGGVQPAERVDQPTMEWVTPEERLLLRFFRQLGEADQLFMRKAVEAVAGNGLAGKK